LLSKPKQQSGRNPLAIFGVLAVELLNPKTDIMKRALFLSLVFTVFVFGSVKAQIDYGDYVDVISDCDFENLCPRLELFTGDSNNIWEVGTPIKAVFNSAHTPLRALVTDTANTYPVSNHSWFDLVIWTPWEFVNPLISFYHKWDMDSLTEGAWIEISYDNGGTWKNIINDTVFFMCYNWPFINSENLYGVNDTLNDGTPAFTGSSNGWVHTAFQWIWFLPVKSDPTTDTVRLRFHFRSDSVETAKDGWMIDDLTLSSVMWNGSVDESGVAVKVNVWPNPVDETLQFYISGERIIKASVFSNEGRLLRTAEGSSLNSISVADLPPGLFFLETQTGSGLISHTTFIKQ
jgi:hypothetical protein